MKLLILKVPINDSTGDRKITMCLAIPMRIIRIEGNKAIAEAYGVERFMRQYLLRAGALRQLSKRVIDRCVARSGSHVEAMMKRLRARDIGDDFVELNRQIHILPAQRECFRVDPVRLLKIFWYRQEMGSPQFLHFPRRRRKLMSGILS